MCNIISPGRTRDGRTEGKERREVGAGTKSYCQSVVDSSRGDNMRKRELEGKKAAETELGNEGGKKKSIMIIDTV